jgi:hypothetical protein
MDNNCAAVTFPDFTRGYWNQVKGYKHAYAPAEDEAKAEAAAKAYTAAQRKVTADFNLWALYDAVKTAKNTKAAQKKYNAAVVKAEKALAKALAQK